MEGALEAIKGLRDGGHVIIIYSVRGDRPGHIQEWMKFYGIPFDLVTNIKLPCDCYVDDKAVGFRGDWKQTIKEMSILIGA